LLSKFIIKHYIIIHKEIKAFCAFKPFFFKQASGMIKFFTERVISVKFLYT